MPRAFNANTVPGAITNRLRSLASRVMTSYASASAVPPGPAAIAGCSTNGITAIEARRFTVVTASRSSKAAAGGDSAADERRVEVADRADSPGCPQRRAVEAFVLEQADGGGQMLLCFPHAAAPHQRVEQQPVHLHIARRQLPPLFQIVERLVVGYRLRQALQQLGMPAAEAVTTRRRAIR